MPAPRSRGGRGAMRAKEMHPLCCISIDCPAVAGDDRSPSPTDRSLDNAGSDGAVAGVLYKWTNFGKGWRSRWFELRNGVLSYSKVRVGDGDVRLIGDPRWHRIDGRRNRQKPAGVVHLKVSSFRESRSDDRRFYIFSTTKTLHLRTDSRKDRVAWIKALLSARCTIPLRSVSDQISFIHNDASISTENLRNRLLEEGINEPLIKDCEQIMLSEFSQVKQLCEERFGVLAFRQLEEHNLDPETVGIQGAPLLLKNGFSSSGHGKYSEYSTTESSDDIEKQELDESSEEDEPAYFDTNECFTESTTQNNIVESIVHASDSANTWSHMRNLEEVHRDTRLSKLTFSGVERRKRLPTPVEKEKSTSLWSIIKDNVGKDLTRVCLPVYFNEPISSLQKCFEDLEYSQLLDRAHEYGKMGNSLMRALHVAAFAVSGYASSDGRPCKPFNPMLGETYEADYPEKGVRFFSEKVSHHPMLIACHCEGRGWKFWGDSNLRSKFWGRSIQLDPVGILTLEFDDGEVFRWSKVTTSIYNLILGKVYCDHHGAMSIQGNREYSCKLRFKEQSLLDRNPRQVQGFVEASCGTKVAGIFGKWDDSLYYTVDGDASRKSADISKDASLLWKRNETPAGLTRYNLTSFAITLNETTPELQDKLPPTDSRRRPDQRHLENGEFEKANAEKQRLENRQRMSRKLQEDGWKPRWFQKDGEDGTYRYVGGYWETRERNEWEGCPNIFGDFAEASVPLK